MEKANLIEGIIINNQVIFKEQFKEQFKEIYQTNKDNFLKDIKNIYDPKKILSKGEVFVQYESLMNKYFHNEPVNLLIAKFEDDNYSYGKIFKEQEAVKKSNIRINKQLQNQYLLKKLEKTQQIKKAKRLEDLFNRHLNDLKTAAKFTGTNSQMSQAHISLYYNWIQMFDRDSHYSGKSLEEIVYKDLRKEGQEQNMEGKYVDAFFNHMAEHHAKYLVLLENIDANIQIQKNFKSIIEEIQWNGLYDLMVNSLNNTSWYKGGDIVIVNSNNEIIYNLQLKTFKSINPHYDIATKTLLQELKNFYDLRNDPDKMADALFEALKINAWKLSEKDSDFIEKTKNQLLTNLTTN